MVNNIEQPLAVLHSESFIAPVGLLCMLPTGRFNVPVVSCAHKKGTITAFPLSNDLTFVDIPWNFVFEAGVFSEFVRIVQGGVSRIALSVRSDDGDNVLIELTGSLVDTGFLEEEYGTLFKVGFWLATSQLAADGGSGFGHMKVAAGLAGASPYAAEVIQAALERARASLTSTGREKFKQIQFPALVSSKLIEDMVANEVPIDVLFRTYGTSQTTTASVWVIAALAKVLVVHGVAPTQSVSTLLAEWIGEGNPWWIWKAVSIALTTYESEIPVSVLESNADGVTGSLFWWLHETSKCFRQTEKKYGRLELLALMQDSFDELVEKELPLMDFLHVLISHSVSEDHFSICGVNKCINCDTASMLLKSSWDRMLVIKLAVRSVLLLSDARATHARFLPGDAAWRKLRSDMIVSFTGAISSKMVNFERKAT